MDTTTGMCGMDCSTCPAHIATVKNDDTERARVAAMWSKMFNAVIQPSDIHCDGCLSGSERLFGHCRECAVRLCGLEKNLNSCAECGSYSCGKLDPLLAMLPPSARENLEAMRKK